MELGGKGLRVFKRKRREIQMNLQKRVPEEKIGWPKKEMGD